MSPTFCNIDVCLSSQELSRSVQLHEKVRARELREKNEKYKKAIEQMKRLEKDHRELQEKLKVCYTIIIAVEIIVLFAVYWTKPIPDKINKTLCPKKTAKILPDKIFFPHKNLVEYIVFLTKLFSTLYC